MNVQISETVECLPTSFLTHLNNLIWYSVALNYCKNKLFLPKTFVCHVEAKKGD